MRNFWSESQTRIASESGNVGVKLVEFVGKSTQLQGKVTECQDQSKECSYDFSEAHSMSCAESNGHPYINAPEWQNVGVIPTTANTQWLGSGSLTVVIQLKYDSTYATSQ